MKIIVNSIPTLQILTGVGQYTYRLLQNLQSLDGQYDWYYYYGYTSRDYVRQRDDASLPPHPGFSKATRLLSKLPRLKAGMRYCQQKAAGLGKATYDVYFEPNFIPLREIASRHTIATIHDFSFRLHPEWHPKERIEHFERHFQSSIERADVILTDSDYIRTEAVRFLDVPPERIRTVHAGCDPLVFHPAPEFGVQRLAAKYHLERPYYLYVGTIEPRKNLAGLLRAWERFAAGQPQSVQLVVCGWQGWGESGIFKEFDRLEKKGVLRYLGYVPYLELPLLYSGAEALVYPSYYEGFGLPVVEAMASGCPVICSDRASLPEVAGDAAIYVDPEEEDSVLQGLVRMQEEAGLRERCREAGLRRARKFTWQNTARSLLGLMSEFK
ncbi:MAG: glycosyltransferase family 1 protein [Acidobacteriota bacterium]|jgi:glycosyltransferase involved in cell wall biosynthesis